MKKYFYNKLYNEIVLHNYKDRGGFYPQNQLDIYYVTQQGSIS